MIFVSGAGARAGWCACPPAAGQTDTFADAVGQGIRLTEGYDDASSGVLAMQAPMNMDDLRVAFCVFVIII
jgi:hypothetical protein